ncbi:unannotated protein [freshwater metagenome]|uniref:Unannotated protein n=1 Tax=freshwater metagenome TaxID=449393 RepID=A0A6J7NHP0_9ZZZZ
MSSPLASIAHSAAAGANRAAVSHWYSPAVAHSRLSAIPGTPKAEPVRAAPTVPEWSVRWPVLAPGLMPDAIRSGITPNAPRQAAQTPVAGGRSIAYTSTPSNSSQT